jgi:hypothetical protein
MPAQIQQGDLTYFAPDSLGAYQSMGEVGFPGRCIIGSGSADKHISGCYQKSKGFYRTMRNIMALQNTFNIHLNHEYILIIMLQRNDARQSTILGGQSLKLG